jgi:hypothetical protein
VREKDREREEEEEKEGSGGGERESVNVEQVSCQVFQTKKEINVTFYLYKGLENYFYRSEV